MNLTRFILIFFSLALFIFSSCKDEEDDFEDDVSQSLEIWIMPNTSTPTRDMNKILKEFRRHHPEINIKVTVLDWGSAWAKITIAASSGNGPDLVQMPTTWGASVTEMDALMNLNDVVSEIGGESVFPKAIWNYAKPWGSDSVTSLPWFIDVRPLFYRKDVLGEIGMKPKELDSWKGFTEALEKIHTGGIRIDGIPIQPIGYPGKNDWNVVHNFAPWIWGAGGSFLNAIGDSCLLNSKESINGIKYYLDMVRKGYNQRSNLEKNTSQVTADFDVGRLAFIFDVANKNNYLQRPEMTGGTSNTTAGRNYGVMMPPLGPSGKRQYFIGGSNISTFKFTKHPVEAKMLLKYLTTNPRVQLELARISGNLPVLNSVLDSPYFTEDPNRRVFVNMIRYGRAYPAVHYWGEIETGILFRRFGALYDILNEQKDSVEMDKKIQEELQKTAKEVNDYISQQMNNNKKLHRKLKLRAKTLAEKVQK